MVCPCPQLLLPPHLAHLPCLPRTPSSQGLRVLAQQAHLLLLLTWRECQVLLHLDALTRQGVLQTSLLQRNQGSREHPLHQPLLLLLQDGLLWQVILTC